MAFKYENWFDESDPVSSIGVLQMMKLTRFKVVKQIKMAGEVRDRYDRETKQFLEESRSDTSQQIIENWYVDGYEPDTLVYDAQ